MSLSAKRSRYKIASLVVLLLCIALSALAIFRRTAGKKDYTGSDQAFTLLILGDSQMAGLGWPGGYQNCISEIYPNAVVFNLAQSGNLLSNGDIQAQWDYYLSKTDVVPDLILLDGGTNDMPYLKKAAYQDIVLPMVSDALSCLLEQIHRTCPDTHIIYTLMPPYAEWKDSEDGPPAYEVQERYWQQLNALASTYDYVTVVDLFSINPFDYPDANTYRANLADSIHLNETGYRNSFEYINHALLSHLAELPAE